jgi:hypothetical protein
MHIEVPVDNSYRSAEGQQDRTVPVLVGCLAAILGAFVRLQPVLTADFPVMDGGLFSVMIRDLMDAGFRLPAITTYNQLSIPFLYPPLSFYAAGLLSAFAGIGLEDILRLLPALLSVLTIPAFYLLARAMLRSPVAIAAAVCAFCLLPTAFDFLIVGGGLPRSFGYLFSILTLSRAADLRCHSGSRNVLGTALLAGLTVLSHPVMAWFTLYSFAVLQFFTDRSRGGVRHYLLVWAGAMLFASPWWVTGAARHGVSAFLTAFQAGSSPWEALLAPFLFLHTNEPYLSLLGVVALLGLFSCLGARMYALPAWLAAVFLLEPRLSATYAALPTALLAGFGFDAVVLPVIEGLKGRLGAYVGRPAQDGAASSLAGRAPGARSGGGWVARLATGYLLLYLLVAAFFAAPREGLTQAERNAMEWVRNSTPAASRFAIVSGIPGAGNDQVSEWFPALTGRMSVATPQGREWLPDRAYTRAKEAHAGLQACAGKDEECLVAWAKGAGLDYTHVFIARHPAGAGTSKAGEGLYASLLQTPAYTLVYDTPDTAVFAYTVADGR